MSEQQQAKALTVLDADTVLADLAAWWGDIKPSPPHAQDMSMLTAEQQQDVRAREMADYMEAATCLSRPREARRIAGGEFDQQVPEGIRNPYWEIIRQLPFNNMPMPWRTGPEPMLHWMGGDYGGGGELKSFADRFDMCGTYSWAICSPGDVAWMKEVLGGRSVVEPGAGTGYWAWQMRQAGIDTVAYEPNEPGPGNGYARRAWADVLPDDHDAPKHHRDRALFLCWPSYAEPWAAQSLSCYAGDLLVYCGEGEGGCTADDAFFELLDAEWEEADNSGRHVSYWGIHDYLTAYRRKGRLARGNAPRRPRPPGAGQ